MGWTLQQRIDDWHFLVNTQEPALLQMTPTLLLCWLHKDMRLKPDSTGPGTKNL